MKIKIVSEYFLEYRQHLLDIFEGLCCQLKRYLILDHQPLHCHSMKTCCYSCRQKNSLKGYTIRNARILPNDLFRNVQMPSSFWIAGCNIPKLIWTRSTGPIGWAFSPSRVISITGWPFTSRYSIIMIILYIWFFKIPTIFNVPIIFSSLKNASRTQEFHQNVWPFWAKFVRKIANLGILGLW